jgi:hypothetical protein
MVHEVQGYYPNDRSKVPYKNKERSVERILETKMRIIMYNRDQGY